MLLQPVPVVLGLFTKRRECYLTFWWERVISVGISFPNLTIAPMNEQFRMLILGNLSSCSNCIRLPVECGC